MTGTDLCVNLETSVPVIFEPPCISKVCKISVSAKPWFADLQTVLLHIQMISNSKLYHISLFLLMYLVNLIFQTFHINAEQYPLKFHC